MDEGVPAALELREEVVDEAVLGAHRPRAVPRVHLPTNNQISDLNFRALNGELLLPSTCSVYILLRARI